MQLHQDIKSSGRTCGNVYYCGDQITITLTLSGNISPGTAFVRTNTGFGRIRRQEIIEETASGIPRSSADWHDLLMFKQNEHTYTLTLPLTETGFFEAKAGWLSAKGNHTLWPGSGNFRIKVEPAATVGANQIYTAFVRQFRKHSAAAEITAAENLLDSKGYTVIPPSGTFRDLIGALDHIFDTLGMRILQLLPVHPVPATYARMGRYGSPFAALDYFAVDPALAEFDKRTTAMEQFCELIDAVHARKGHIFMDIPVNHTGWGSRTQEEHPELFKRANNGDFASPGAWGVVWEDLCSLDYSLPAVHELMADVFLFWCRKGIDGFRCDAGYMLPAEAWDYITAKVRTEYPDTIFLLEGLGGPLDKQRELLLRSGLDWGYSELFQNYSMEQIGWQYGIISSAVKEYGNLVNFSETHDNSRLAAVSTVWSRMRMALCALLSENGAFGFANGAEFFATEQINVHGNSDLKWDAAVNQINFIAKLNNILSRHPAFYAGSTSRWISGGNTSAVKILRTAANSAQVLVIVNTDTVNPCTVKWSEKDFHCTAATVDLLSGHNIVTAAGEYICQLAPGDSAVLGHPEDLTEISNGEPLPVTVQRAAELAQKIWCRWNKPWEKPIPPVKELLTDLKSGFAAFAEKYSGCTPAPVTEWRIPEDTKRTVIVPSGDLLCIESAVPFVFCINDDAGRTAASGKSASAPGSGDNLWACLLPDNTGDTEKYYTVCGCCFTADGIKKFKGQLLQPPAAGAAKLDFTIPGSKLTSANMFLGTNCYGGMAQIRAKWGEINSKYDCWLGANCSTEFPQDRRIMLSRVRGWIVCDGYSTELSAAVTKNFTAGNGNKALWLFDVPVGSGRKAELAAVLRFSGNSDAVKAEFFRTEGDTLDDDTTLKIILRPDVDDRINHCVTKAFTGPENSWPAAVSVHKKGFDFAPGSIKLKAEISAGSFVYQPEWHYMQHLADEACYGLESETDIFSPGYFEFTLRKHCTVILTAQAFAGELPPSGNNYPSGLPERYSDQLQTAIEALRRYIVKRNEFSTVIAGYPWFLDWGRDTFIALRGLIAAGFTAEAEAIILQFASFEERGTIPNMIHGSDVSNRDTGDAPLWLITVVSELVEHTGSDGIMNRKTADGRTVEEVLYSIIRNYICGTPNGIKADDASMLIYSPPHFTWMDTNYPAATPREGYPIEIQALWFAANNFLGSRGYGDCAANAAKTRASIEKYFYMSTAKQFSDCLHCHGNVPAAQAVADNAVRPNALLAITLGAVTDPEQAEAIINGTSCLLVPGAIRSLADRKVTPPLPVYNNGRLLNDPHHPYQGVYAGNEDACRKPAYHNGTAWCWPFPGWVEAALLFSDRSRYTLERLQSILYSSHNRWLEGAAGELPEVADGNAPHRWGGCGAQAWSVTEFYRVAKILQSSLLK